ncbi:hypothetical protein PR202_ga24633 [Eleusine coracana subsp. coracana]|uniref:Uncharacterized protein n=1 Tax=Eleusine coracana subsp. coracana TaxID=191504 RepID=A0AAV5D888_ELECO|nr:hypothetical protein PR202_ga24633 [Eleusine coracana subsp. coracana]
MQHALVGCVFARDFWFRILQAFNLQQLVPENDELDCAAWWRRASNRVAKQHRKGLNTLIILGAWTIWKHRNAVVFDGISPNIQVTLDNLRLEAQLWTYAGAKSLWALGLGRFFISD